jgi:hypothetical protein
MGALMHTLFDDRFAPITSRIGFIRLPLEATARALAAWLEQIHGEGITSTAVNDGFPSCLRRLEPLTGGAVPRELLVRHGPDWTAYFNCFIQGTDAVGPVSYLTSSLHRDGLILTAIPDERGRGGVRGRWGVVQFELLGPEDTTVLNFVRTVYAMNDGGHWEFGQAGTPQPFEELEAYSRRSIRERFTGPMLERYAQALGVDPFNEAAYGPEAILVANPQPVPPGGLTMSLVEVQNWLGIARSG